MWISIHSRVSAVSIVRRSVRTTRSRWCRVLRRHRRTASLRNCRKFLVFGTIGWSRPNRPTGALVRVDPIEYFSEIGPSQGFVFRDQTHAVGRNIHKSDPVARAWHLGGAAVTILTAGVLFWALGKYGFDTVLAGTWLTLRWLTGI